MTGKEMVKIGIVGGGPSALFMLKRLLDQPERKFTVDVFERKGNLGEGMPYSREGASHEHITNVSDNEIPDIVTHINEWIKTAPESWVKEFSLDPNDFNEYKVLPRLFFGQYLCAQFSLILKRAKDEGITVTVHYKREVTDVSAHSIETNKGERFEFDFIVICSGHNWPVKKEGKVPGYFDSPYPPKKLEGIHDHPIAVRGASLTAIDAVRTLARQHGSFYENDKGCWCYKTRDDISHFHVVMHSIRGMLPAIRFHLEDSHLSKDSAMSPEETRRIKDENDGFIPLDYLFERHFKDPIRQQDPDLYDKIKNMNMEEFVEHAMAIRENLDPFTLFKAEFTEAEKSIKRRESVYWKEMLAVLSFAMNYPAKHMSAEDMQRLQKTLMPLISLVIAFVPQQSCRDLIAMYDSGYLSLIAVGKDSRVEPGTEGCIYHYEKDHQVAYPMFIDCIGQPHLSIQDFPFKGIVNEDILSPAKILYQDQNAAAEAFLKGEQKVIRGEDGRYYLPVPGVAINDHFQPLDRYGAATENLFIMAVPYIGGFNPDYSGLDFCEEASGRIMERLQTALSA